MTKLLTRAFEEALRLPVKRQDELARTLLDDLARESPPADASPQVPHPSTGNADGALARLVRKGWLTPPTAISQDRPPRVPVAPFHELMKELDDDRSDR